MIDEIYHNKFMQLLEDLGLDPICSAYKIGYYCKELINESIYTIYFYYEKNRNIKDELTLSNEDILHPDIDYIRKQIKSIIEGMVTRKWLTI